MLGQLPPKVDLSADFPDPGNQEGQASCVGWAVSYLKAYQERKERKWESWSDEKTFSPAYVYNQLKLTPDCSGGTYIAEALNLMRRDGVATRAVFPYIHTSCFVIPDESVKQKARMYAISDWRRVNAQDETELNNHVASGFPIVIGAIVDDAFVRLSQGVYRTRGGTQLGGHAMVIVGYDDAQSAFKLINSWGKSWGTAGYGYVGYPALKSMVREAYVVQDIVTSPVPAVITGPPQRQPVFIPASNFVRGFNVAVGQCGPYGVNVLLNGAPCNGRPNAAEYEFFVVSGGLYRMSAEYASAEARPLKIILNGSVVMTDAMAQPTGCWTEDCQRSIPQGNVTLATGPNTLRLERPNVFPHLRSITFEPLEHE